MKKMQPNFQEPVVEYCEPEQVIDICSYNHYLILDKSSPKQHNSNDDKDIYDTSELEHEFEYGIYEDVLKTEQFMAELKRIDEAENENKKTRDVHFGNFPLEQFSDAGKVANEGDPKLKAAADTELHEIEKRAIQIDTEKYEYDNSSEYTDDDYSSQQADDYSSQRADDYSSQRADDDDENDITLQTEGFVLYANVQKVLNVRVRRCVCVCGEMYLLLVRGVSRSKTLIPLILVTIWLDAFYYNNK